MGKLYDVGNFIIFGIKVQLYFLFAVIKGGIIFGIFPGFLLVYRIVLNCIDERSITHVGLLDQMEKIQKNEKMKSNVIGYISAILLVILTFNLQISNVFFQSVQFNILTLVLMVAIVATTLHTLPILSKYELPIKQYFLQAFLLSIISIFDTLAMIIGMILAAIFGFIIPPLGLFAGIPLIFIPYVWFSKSAIKRLETVLYKMKEENDAQ